MPRLLLRNGYRYQGKANWCQAHMRYLRELVLPDPAQKAVLEDYLQAVDAAAERVARYEASMKELLDPWRLKPEGGLEDAAMLRPAMSYFGSAGRPTPPRDRGGRGTTFPRTPPLGGTSGPRPAARATQPILH